MMRCCWICLRRLPVRAMEFVQMEDDGCGEWECLDRRGCFFAFLDRDERMPQ